MLQRPTRRRGVILLIVLSLLVIFMLAGTTFLIVSGTYRSAAEVSARLGAKQPEPRKITEDALVAMMADTVDPQSVLRGHSLLRDMYGDDGFTATVETVLPIDGTGRQFVAVSLVSPQNLNGQPYNLRLTEDFYNGLVLTFVDGSAKGMSTRIIDYFFSGAGVPFFVLMPTEEGETTNLPQMNSRVVINGRPFSGSGFGFNPATAQNDLGDSEFSGNFPIALEPNRVLSARRMRAGADDINAFLSGGADESYDAADYQNVHLAAQIPRTDDPTRVAVLPSFHRPAMINWWLHNVIAPQLGVSPQVAVEAFLRPYGRDNLRDTGDDPAIPLGTRDRIVEIKRKIILRPLPELNPQFTGSNEQFRTALQVVSEPHWSPYLVGPWDVDNDGDGDPDSIWIDAGLPIQEDSQGRLYKPLVAVLCTDLDGRLNVNAHGSHSHLLADFPGDFPSSWVIAHPTTVLAGNADSATPTATDLVSGLGAGPADINLRGFFGPLAYRSLLRGFDPAGPGRIFPGRYFSRFSFGNGGPDTWPGRPGFADLVSRTKFGQYPIAETDLESVSAIGRRGGFESPADLHGELQVAVDHLGQPSFTRRNPNRALLVDHPYESNLVTESADDQHFNVAELEKLLRFHDEDVKPVGRPAPVDGRFSKMFFDAAGRNLFTHDIRDNTNTILMNASLNRRLITTRSFDLPVPNMLEPPDLVDRTNPLAPAFWPDNVRFHHVVEILRARLIEGMAPFIANFVSDPNDPTQLEPVLNAEIRKLLSPDLKMGLRMDINRPFGNGVDDNGNGVVDEPMEALLGEAMDFTGLSSATVGFDHDNDGNTTNPGAYYARAHYARHLYILMMMLMEYVDPNLPVAGKPDPRETARQVAQWAVNVVDFRDSDSIMTPFEFDLTPFTPHQDPNGQWRAPWDVDGVISQAAGLNNDPDAIRNSDRAVVWGVERPELLITETLAFHDRRTEDLDDDDGVQEFTESKDGSDETFDQRLVPRGSFYVELFNPWTSPQLRKPQEFYNGTSSASGVVLDRMAPLNPTDPSARRSPVWRLFVASGTAGEDSTMDIDAPYDKSRKKAKAEDRVVYFGARGQRIGTETVFPDPATPEDDPLLRNSDALEGDGPFAPLLGGRYAVVGTVRGRRMRLPDPHDSAGNSEIDDWINPLGRRTDATEGDLQREETRRIVLQPHPNPNLNRVFVEENGDIVPLPIPDDGDSSVDHDALPPVAIPIARLNVTEDLFGEWEEPGPPNAAGEESFEPPLDIPLDSEVEYLRDDGMHYFDPEGWDRVVHLQRLANPLQAWNPYPGETGHDPNFPVNPYLTVDTMPVDLASFNGVNDDEDPLDSGPGFTTTGFFSRQRGERDPEVPYPTEVSSPRRIRTLWKRDTDLSAPVRAERGGPNVLSHFFTQDLIHSLGFLNDLPDRPIYGPRFTRTTAPFVGFIGAPNTRVDPISSESNGPPFPWFNWLNRPFVSHQELLQIPKGSSFKSLEDWSTLDLTRNDSPYDEPTPTKPAQADFGHLLNFFSSSNPAPGDDAANLAQLFEFVHVPSRFVGTDTVLNPTEFSKPDTISQGPTTVPSGAAQLHPPFNRISKYREPGKVNLNTVYAPIVLDAIRGASGNVGVGPFFNQLANSRRGFGEQPPFRSATVPNPNDPLNPFTGWIWSGTQVPTYDPTSDQYDPVVNLFPTIFANPFRGFGDARLIPLPNQQRPFVEATWLRSNRAELQNSRPTSVVPDWPRPLNAAPAPSAVFAGRPDAPLLARTEGRVFNDPDRNSHFRYEAMQRFANLVTTRSNVYAVWVTVGFFEVENVRPDWIPDATDPNRTKLSPFGYRLGAELGWDTGDVNRHRAFYIIDRSIPVAFEPGKRHNIDKAILVKRFIE